MSEKERANLTDTCPEFTDISKGLRFKLDCTLGVANLEGNKIETNK